MVAFVLHNHPHRMIADYAPGAPRMTGLLSGGR